MERTQRKVYQAMVASFENKTGQLFNPDGTPMRQRDLSDHFWRGYDGIDNRPPHKKSVAYACWKAGKACRGATSHINFSNELSEVSKLGSKSR